MVLDVAQQLYYISPSPFLFPPPRPFQTFSNFHIPLTPHLPSSLSQNTPSHLSTPQNTYPSTVWLPCHPSKSTLQPSTWALDSTLLATEGNCPVILPPLSYITKFPSQSIIPIIPWTCWHFSHLTKNNYWFHPPPQLLPYFSTPFHSKMPKTVIYTRFLCFSPSSLSWIHHSLETTHIQAISDLHAANSGGQFLVLTFPGLSAVFSTVVHPLGNMFFTWLQDSTLSWFSSHFTAAHCFTKMSA